MELLRVTGTHQIPITCHDTNIQFLKQVLWGAGAAEGEKQLNRYTPDLYFYLVVLYAQEKTAATQMAPADAPC